MFATVISVMRKMRKLDDVSCRKGWLVSFLCCYGIALNCLLMSIFRFESVTDLFSRFVWFSVLFISSVIVQLSQFLSSVSY